jgi:hypothetical protein
MFILDWQNITNGHYNSFMSSECVLLVRQFFCAAMGVRSVNVGNCPFGTRCSRNFGLAFDNVVSLVHMHNLFVSLIHHSGMTLFACAASMSYLICWYGLQHTIWSAGSF